MSYTKGEWKVERVPIQSAGGSNTCFQIGPFKACIYDDWRQYQEYGISTLENEANAKLIAAAPDLLEACELALSLLNLPSNEITKDDKKEIADAILKAVG
jgi:hypothetical protein